MQARRRPFNIKPPSRNPASFRTRLTGPRLKPPSIVLTYGQATAVARSLPTHLISEFTGLTRAGKTAKLVTLDELRGILRKARDHHLQSADAAGISSAEKTRLTTASRTHIDLLNALATANKATVLDALTRFSRRR